MNMLTRVIRRSAPYVMLGLVLLLVTGAAFASDAQTGLEWEGPLIKIYKSFTGPVAFVLSVVGIVVAGATLLWGGEINEFARRMIMLAMVISVIVFAVSFVRTLFGGAAATMDTHPSAVSVELERDAR